MVDVSGLPTSITAGDAAHTTGHQTVHQVLKLIDAQGDLLVGSGADAIAKLTKGTALQNLRVNAAATDLEYASPLIGARAYRSTDLAVPSATFTSIPLDTELFDVGALHSTVTNTSRFTVPYAGTWLFFATAGFYSSSAGTLRYIRLLKNGSTPIAECYFAPAPGAGAITTVQATSFEVLAATDYVEAQLYQDSGGSLNAYGLSYRTWMAAIFLGA